MEDIFKKSFLKGYASTEISTQSVFMAILITFVIGIYIFWIYKSLTKKSFYSKNFNMSLVGVAMITAAIIVTIQSSIVVSLGMVGALSIVRFRTAIKNPMDLMFLFWSISVGIICGAGFALFAVILSVLLTIAMLILDRFPISKPPMILVVNSRDINSEKKIAEVVRKYAKHYTVKARNMKSDSLDMTIELRTDSGADLVKEIVGIKDIVAANLLQHDGEVTY